MEGQISPARLGFLMIIFLPDQSEVQTAKMSMDLDEAVPISDFHAQQQPEATCVSCPDAIYEKLYTNLSQYPVLQLWFSHRWHFICWYVFGFYEY